MNRNNLTRLLWTGKDATMQGLIEKAAVLIEALPYIQQFRDSLVVVKLGGSTMEDPACTRGVLRDVVFMECVGMKPIIVHGGGKAISARLREAGVETRFIHGLRYTGDDTIEVVDRVLHGEVNRDLVRMMNEFGGDPCAVSGKDVLTAEELEMSDPDTGDRLDLGHVGRVVEVNTTMLTKIIDRREVPVMTPLGRGRDGRVYNINADMVACCVAEALSARKLVFLSDVPGILRDPNDENTLISTIHTDDIDGLVAAGTLSAGMLPKIRSAVHALHSGTQQVHLIDGRVQHSLLLEIFTDKGVGTQIVA